jgi:hypothetical protein
VRDAHKLVNAFRDLRIDVENPAWRERAKADERAEAQRRKEPPPPAP